MGYENIGYVTFFRMPPKEGPEGSEFRAIRKNIPELQQKHGQKRRLMAELAELQAQLAELDAMRPPTAELPAAAESGQNVMKSQRFFDALSTYLTARGAEV